MNKRLEKRHKRQVARAKERAKPSEPDVRTPEELAAAREASGSIASQRTDHRAPYSAPSVRNQADSAAANTQKADAAP